MPVPSPRDGQDKDQFISTCISALKNEDPDRSDAQAAAICYSQWRGETIHPDFQRILVTFISHFRDGTGLERFSQFITNNALDIARKYHPFNQFNESFQWVKPLIQHYKSDKDAKYYLIRALTANLSMNENDYSDYQRLVRAAPSMKFKPCNYNHDPERWIAYPRTRVDMVGMEDLAMELTLRVDNRDHYLQMQIDHDPSVPRDEWINHPSIQGYENVAGEIEYLGLALLERGYQLPGDPLTEIVPLILNEGIRSKFCKIVDGLVVCEVGETSKGDRNMENTLSRVEQMTETPPESTVMSDEERAFMDECTTGGKSHAECAAEWLHKLGAAQPPATTVPDYGSPTTPLSQEEPPLDPLTAAPLPITEPPVVGAGAEQMHNEPPPDTDYDDEHAAFMQACSAQGKSQDECEADWQLRQELPSEFQPPATESRILALSERTVQLQAELGAKATREVTLLNENATLREQLSSASKTTILYDAEKEHVRLLKNENTQLRDHIQKKDALLTNTKDQNLNELKEKLDQVRRLERKVDAKDTEVKDLEEQVDKLAIQGTRLRRDVSSLTTNTTKSNERARNAVKERSDIQVENANLRDEAARLTRQLSNLTGQRAADAKKIHGLETRGLKMNEALSGGSTAITSMQKDFKVLNNRLDKAWKKLNELGEYYVAPDGTIVEGPPQ